MSSRKTDWRRDIDDGRVSDRIAYQRVERESAQSSSSSRNQGSERFQSFHNDRSESFFERSSSSSAAASSQKASTKYSSGPKSAGKRGERTSLRPTESEASKAEKEKAVNEGRVRDSIAYLRAIKEQEAKDEARQQAQASQKAASTPVYSYSSSENAYSGVATGEKTNPRATDPDIDRNLVTDKIATQRVASRLANTATTKEYSWRQSGSAYAYTPQPTPASAEESSHSKADLPDFAGLHAFVEQHRLNFPNEAYIGILRPKRFPETPSDEEKSPTEAAKEEIKDIIKEAVTAKSIDLVIPGAGSAYKTAKIATKAAKHVTKAVGAVYQAYKEGKSSDEAIDAALKEFDLPSATLELMLENPTDPINSTFHYILTEKPESIEDKKTTLERTKEALEFATSVGTILLAAYTALGPAGPILMTVTKCSGYKVIDHFAKQSEKKIAEEKEGAAEPAP